VQDTFDFLDWLFTLFREDEVLTELLEITDTNDVEQWDRKARRTFADNTQITVDELSFFDFSFIYVNSEMRNHLFNKEMLEFNIYVPNLSRANEIYKAIKKILKSNCKDMRCTTPVQAGCPVSGILRYTFRARPIVGA